MVPSSIGTVMRRCQLKCRARLRTLAGKIARLSASPLNLASRGAIALLYNLVAIVPVLGSSKLRTACECPGPNAKAGSARGTGRGAGGDTIYIKTQVFRLLRYYSPAPRNITRSDWATQNIKHNMTSSIT